MVDEPSIVLRRGARRCVSESSSDEVYNVQCDDLYKEYKSSNGVGLGVQVEQGVDGSLGRW